MTAIFYSDRDAISPNKKFVLQARSPHNGTINNRDGSRPRNDEFAFKYREHQSNFRYQLIEKRDRRLIWERWQREGEDSPHELVVSDEGWSIIRTHGFRPEVIAVSPEGQDDVRVRITIRGSEEDDVRRDLKTPMFFWRPTCLNVSTAGAFWTTNSWRYFCHPNDESSYFAWRANSGERLILDLGGGNLLAPAQVTPRLIQALVDEETRGVHTLLSELYPKMEEVQNLLLDSGSEETKEHPLRDKLHFASAALKLAGVHRIKNCIPFLRAWEKLDFVSYYTRSCAMVDHNVEAQLFRPIVNHALQELGEQPTGYPAYHFST